MKKYALIGKDISYSLSPKIHGLIFAFFGLDNYSYEILDISEDYLEKNFAYLTKEFCGFNVTIPYKNIISKYVGKSFSQISAINTVVSKNGETLGYNTDIDGFRHHFTGWIRQQKNTNANSKTEIGARETTSVLSKNVENDGYCVRFDNILVIGAGGAAEAAIHSLSGLCHTMSVKARQGDKLSKLTKRYKINQDYKSTSPTIIINASGKSLIHDGLLDDICTKNLAAVYDISYNNKGQKEFFGAKNIAYTDGLGMLIYQAIYAAKLLYQVETDDKTEKLFDYILEKI